MNGMTSTGFTVWFTGMSGAGKSTLATGLANRLRRLGKTVEVLDGGEAEQFLNVAHGQNKDERNLEARKLAWVCRLITRGGGIVLQAAIESPYKETRDEARRQIGRFAQVFVECPIETLIQREDRKSTRLNSSHGYISYAVFCLKKKKKKYNNTSTITFEDDDVVDHHV